MKLIRTNHPLKMPRCEWEWAQFITQQHIQVLSIYKTSILKFYSSPKTGYISMFSRWAALSYYFLFIAKKLRTVKVSLVKDHNFPCYQQLTVKRVEVCLFILNNNNNNKKSHFFTLANFNLCLIFWISTYASNSVLNIRIVLVRGNSG